MAKAPKGKQTKATGKPAASKDTPPQAPPDRTYHIGTANVGPGAVFGDDRSTGKKISGGDFVDLSQTGDSGDTLKLVLGLVLIVVGLVVSFLPIALPLAAKFVLVFVIALGGALLTNGLTGKMQYKKGPVKAWGSFAVFALIAAVGGGVLLHGSGSEKPAPAVPPSSQPK
jgi:hypothetical protein